ncbi:MAG: hypothetical protein ING32_15140, partial [Curvibacter sp.]|nr:hypothetical protein [Curvibacter sp.]
MPNAITTAQLQQYRQAIENGGASAAAQVYAELYAQGYNYAGWAEGVAKGNTITGLSALDFLKDSYFAATCNKLSDAQIDKIRADMAKRTLDEYIKIAENSPSGKLERDLTYKETKDVHKDAFEGNDLSLKNWTLDTPMEIIRQQHGDQVVENLWKQIRDTGGDYVDALTVSSILADYVWGASHSPNPEVRERAERWLEHVVPDWLQGNFFGKPCDNPFKRAKRWQPPRDPIVVDLDGDGIETVGLASNVYFDHDGDGVLTKTGWAGKDDALLVWDRNANGSIDTGAELFGDF